MRPLLLVLLIACNGDTRTDSYIEPSSCEGSPLRYDTFAEPMVTTWCTPCHNSALDGIARSGAPDGLNFDTYALVLEHGSTIRASLDAERMPPVGGLSPDDRANFGKWVDCGMPGTSDSVVPAPCANPVSQGSLDCSAGAVALTGDLVATDQDLSCLCSVAGNVTASGAFAAPQLQSIGGDLLVSEASVVTAANLTEINGLLSLTSPNLTFINLDALESVNGVHVEATALTRLSLPRLAQVHGDLVVTGNPVLVSGMRFSAITSIDGSVRFSNNPVLPGYTLFGHLERVDGDLIIEDNDAATTVLGLYELPALGGSLIIRENPLLELVNVGIQLEGIGGSLELVDNHALTAIATFPVLTSIGANGPNNALLLRGNQFLLEFDVLPALTDLSAVQIEFHLRLLGVGPLNVTSLTGDYILRENASLVAFGDMPVTQIAGQFDVSENPSLATLLHLTSLQNVGGDLTIVNNQTMAQGAATGFASGLNIGGAVSISGNGQ